jgi:transketolase
MSATGTWTDAYRGATRDVCRRVLLELARVDPRVICLDSDTGGLKKVFAELPDQYVNVGIAEANMMSMAAGLAAAGMRPFAHTISGFAAARACEQIKIDVAGNNLPVRIVVTHGGLSAGHYGPTHHAVEDIALMRTMPNMTVLVPADAVEADRALRAAHDLPGPVFLRLGRKPTPLVHREPCDFEVGRALLLGDGDDVTLVATGPYPVLMAVRARALLARRGVRARLFDMHTVKPLDREALARAARETGGIVTVEDHVLVGGLGGAVCEEIAERCPCPVRRIGVPDGFCDRVGGERYLLTEAGVSAERIVVAALDLLGSRAGR